MRTRIFVVVATIGLSVAVAAQNPPPPPPTGQQQTTQPPPAGQRGGGQGRGRGGVQTMTLFSTWGDGGMIPTKYTQAGEEVSPPLAWTNPPDTTASFVLLVHDLDAVTADGTTESVHWLVWNIPGSARILPEAVPQGPDLPDGSRQISRTGPNYRGPAAPATGPLHHYVFELYALDATIDVPAVIASPDGRLVSAAATRTAVFAAMAGHVRGKATLTGVWRRLSSN
jgi:Raf kinase inhibitor-like YbhB/YbcL family protein